MRTDANLGPRRRSDCDRTSIGRISSHLCWTPCRGGPACGGSGPACGGSGPACGSGAPPLVAVEPYAPEVIVEPPVVPVAPPVVGYAPPVPVVPEAEFDYGPPPGPAIGGY